MQRRQWFNPMPNICYDAHRHTKYHRRLLLKQVAYRVQEYSAALVYLRVDCLILVAAGIGRTELVYLYGYSGGCVDTASNPITVWDTASAQNWCAGPALWKSPVVSTVLTQRYPLVTYNQRMELEFRWSVNRPVKYFDHCSAFTFVQQLRVTGAVTLSVTTSNGCRSTVRTMPVPGEPYCKAGLPLRR